MDDGTLELARWHDYVIEHGRGLDRFWHVHLMERPRHVLVVVGRGFDPRMCLGLEVLLRVGGYGKRDVLAVEFDEGPASPSVRHAAEASANWERLVQLVDGAGTVQTHTVEMLAADGRRTGSLNAASVFINWSSFFGYTDIVVDISALPRSIYYPMLGKILHLLDTWPPDLSDPKPNLHILVAENAALDIHIREEGVADTADYIHSFEGGVGMEATAEIPRIWIPIMGEGQDVQFERIYDLVSPDEICPVLPSPSLNPRRGDDLVLAYRDLLFDRLRVDPHNFIYAAERNPFEVYRQIRRTILHYRNALQPLGGCKSVISAFSSKLMSVGALLVAYELKQKRMNVGIAHVEVDGHAMDGSPEIAAEVRNTEVFGLWLSGECYGA